MPDSGASSVVAVPARLQDVIEADDVALDVRVGVCDAVPYPACAARLTTTEGMNSPNMRSTALLSAMESRKNTKRSPYALSRSSLPCFSLTS